MDVTRDDLPVEPLEAMGQVSQMLEELRPGVQKTIGAIAAMGANAQTQSWVNTLADRLDEVHDAYTVLFRDLAQAPTFTGSNEEAEDETLEDEPEEVDQPEPIEDTNEVSEGPGIEADIKLVDGLSPNEYSAVRAALTHLSGTVGKASLKTIIDNAFGTKRLPNTEEKRLVQILNDYAEAGVLTAYGTAFGFAPASERSADSRPDEVETDPLLTDEEDELLSFMRANPDCNKLNIGQIVRGYTGQQTLDRQEYTAFVSMLNGLADRGYVLHETGSPWYGIAESNVPDVSVQRPVYPSIQTPALLVEAPATVSTAAPVEDEVLEDEEQEPEQITEPQGPSSYSFNISAASFNDREEDMFMVVLQTVSPGLWFSRGDFDFYDLGFANDAAERRGYSAMVAKLVEAGMAEGNGARGSAVRYRLVATSKNEPLLAEQSPDPVEVPQEPVEQIPAKISRSPQKPARYYDKAATELEEAAQPDAGPAARRSFTDEEVEAFTGKFNTRLREYLQNSPEGRRKVREARLWVAAELKVPEQAAGLAIKNAMKAQDGLVITGMEGYSYLMEKSATEQGESAAAEGEPAVSEAELSRIAQLRELHGDTIIKTLSKLAKNQSEFKTAIATALKGTVSVDDINPICRMLENEGLVKSFMPKGRGTGRTRKGVTWNVTSKGRAVANASGRQNGPTNAEKKALGWQVPAKKR